MSLATCIRTTAIDPDDVADIRTLVRANKGDEAAGIQQYLDGLLGDLEGVREDLAGQGFGGQAGGETFFQTPRERLRNRKPVRQPRGSTYMGVVRKYTIRNPQRVAPALERNAALIQNSTNAGNADGQSEALDALLEEHPDPLASESAWARYANDAFSLSRVPMPPFRSIELLAAGPDAIAAEISGLSEGMIRDSEGGMATAREFGEAYSSGLATPGTTAKVFLWSFLSRTVTPYVQEAAFLDAMLSPELNTILDEAIESGWNDGLEERYRAWSVGALPPGSPGRATQHNLNAYGRSFLRVMTQTHADAGGRTGLQIIHDMIVDGTSSKEIRREFLKRGDGSGIDNKVVSFTLLLLGRTDVLVLDRVQVRNQWNDGRFDGQNIYDVDKDADGNPIAGSAFAEMTFGHKGLLYYEAMERALAPIIEEAYASVGRQGSLGQYHWDSWLAASNQEVGHASIEGLLAQTQGKADAFVGIFVRQGKYDRYDYGFRYTVLPDGSRGVVADKLDGSGSVLLPAGAISDPKSALRKGLGKLATKAKKSATMYGTTAPWTAGLTASERGQYDRALEDSGTPAQDHGLEPADAVGRAPDAPQADEPGGVRVPHQRSFRGRTAQAVAVAEGDRPVHEITDGTLFRELIVEAKEDLGVVGAQVHAYDDYAGKRLFLFDDGHSGFALDGDDIISVFSTPGTPPRAAQRVLEVAVAEGGRRLDGFDTFLPKVYAKGGFRAVAKLPFDREHAPDGWDYGGVAELFPETAGEPDVVFMVYDPENAAPATGNGVPDYDAGVAAQQAALDEIGPQTFEQFAGPSAATAPSTYEEAIVRLADGENPEAVWQDLGWFKGADGRMRFEVSDDGAAIDSQWAGKPIPAVSNDNPYPVYLKDVLTHDALYDAYPILKTIQIRTSRDLSRDGIVAGVSEDRLGPRIVFDEKIWATGKRPDGSDIDVLSVLLHEVQHLIQQREGFASGTSLKAGLQAYRQSAGETEARATEARAGLTAAERSEAFPVDATVGDVSSTTVIQEPVTVEQARDIVAFLREQARQEATDARFKAFAAEHADAFREVWDHEDSEHFLFYSARNILLDNNSDEWPARVVDFVRETAGETLTQDDDGSTGPRGSITFPAGGPANGETLIKLLETANLSTFLHESGHFFLAVSRDLADRADAPAAMKADMAAVLDFLGNTGEPFTTAQQEKWARSFEAYLLEGKAPSLELADAFSRFKAWLKRLYQSATGLGVKLTPEIREVMDRMLATEAEIDAARAEAGMNPLFPDAEAAGISPAAYAPYERSARRSKEEGEQRLLAKTMAKVRRARERWFEDEKAAVREEVKASVDRRPEYRLIEAMANKRWREGEEMLDMPDARLDRDALVERYGDGILAALGRKAFGGKRAIYGGTMSVDQAAEFFGFRDGDTMILALMNTEKRKDAISDETDRIMLERHGDPLNDGSIEEEALLAVHSEQQAQTVATEARTLAGRAGKSTRGITARIFRQRARLMLGRMTVRAAVRPAAFLRAGRKAARAAEREFAKVMAAATGGRSDPVEALAAAHRFKEQELLNHYLYLEAREMEARVKRGREKMRAYSKRSVRAKLAGGYIEQIDALLEDHDFRGVTQKALGRRESLLQYVERMKADGREAELGIDERLIENARKIHYSQMTVDELQGLFDTIENIDHMGRRRQKLIDAKEERDLAAIEAEISAEFLANVKSHPPAMGSQPKGEKKRLTLRDALNWTLTADTLLREIDGFKDLGPAWRHIKQGIDEAMARLVIRRQEMAVAFDALYARYSDAEKRDMNVKRAIPGANVSLSKWDVIAVALNTGNEQNYQRLTSRTKGSLTPGQVDAVMATMDRRDWETVQDTWDYINSFWPEIEAKERRQKGVAPKKVEAKAMVPAFGFVTGGYYPIRFDARFSGLTGDRETRELADALRGGRFGGAQTRDGHTRARAQNVRMPVQLDIAVGHQHVQQVLHDLELSETMAASWKILQRIKPLFLEHGRMSDFEALEIWLQDTAAGEQISARGWEKIARHVRSGFTISRLAINISTALIQPTGILQTAVQLGKVATAKGYASYMRNPNAWRRRVLDASPLMRERQKTFQRDIFNIVGDISGDPAVGRYQKWMRDIGIPASFWLMQKTQFHAVDMPTWVAAYEQEVARSGDEGRARTHADQMVRRAQGSGLMSDRGMLERGTTARDSRQREFPRMLTALGSYMFAKFNVAYEKTAGTDFRSPAQVMSLAIDYVLLFTMEAFFYQLVKGGLPDGEDDDDTWPEWAIKETALSAMSTLPYLRELSGALQGFGGGGILGSGIEAIARPIIQTGQGEADKAWLKSVVNFGGVMLHLPASQFNTAIDALFDEDLSPRSDASLAEVMIRRRD